VKHQPRRHSQLEQTEWPGLGASSPSCTSPQSVHDNPDLVALFPAHPSGDQQACRFPVRRARAQERGQRALSSLRRIPLAVFGWTRAASVARSLPRVWGRPLQEDTRQVTTGPAGVAAGCLPALPFFPGMLISKVEMTLSKVDLDSGPSLR